MDFEVPKAEFAFEIRVRCSPPSMIGRTPEGNARLIPIVGGEISGPRLSGTVLPGGADWPVIRDDGTVVVEAHYAIQAEDGAIIQVFNHGIAVFAQDGASGRSMRTVPRFVAPDGPHSWLNRSIFVGTLEANPNDLGNVVVRVFELR
jgi:hypothetical protein